MHRISFTISFLTVFLYADSSFCQHQGVIQYSGIVYANIAGEKKPLPFTGIGILRTRQGTYSNENGFFSLAAESGDTIMFSSLGYKPLRKILPSGIISDRYYEDVLLEQDTFQLESAIVYSIPSKEHFRPEFLAMDVSDKLAEEAKKNLAQDVLNQIAPHTPSDGTAGVSMYFQQEANKMVYDGQFKPQPIFNLFSWIEFFKAWKRGDFKKKKKVE